MHLYICTVYAYIDIATEVFFRSLLTNITSIYWIENTYIYHRCVCLRILNVVLYNALLTLYFE